MTGNEMPLLEWEYTPPIGPRPMRGFVGLKNAGATCYMNSVIQQVYITVRKVILTEDKYSQKLFSSYLSIDFCP